MMVLEITRPEFTVMTEVVKNIDMEPLNLQIEKVNRRIMEAEKRKNNWRKKLPKKRRKARRC